MSLSTPKNLNKIIQKRCFKASELFCFLQFPSVNFETTQNLKKKKKKQEHFVTNRNFL